MSNTKTHLFNQNPNLKFIKSSIDSILSGKQINVNFKLLSSLSTLYSEETNCLLILTTIFEFITENSSHEIPIYKSLILLNKLIKKNSNYFFKISLKFLNDIETISLLTFESKKSSLRKQIHQLTYELYNFLISNNNNLIINNKIENNSNSIVDVIEWDEISNNQNEQKNENENKINFQYNNEEDPFDDFIGYDPFIKMILPNSFDLNLIDPDQLIIF